MKQSQQADYISKPVLNWFLSVCTYPYTWGENILDLIFADDSQTISHIDAIPPVGRSDHCILNFKFVINSSYLCNTERSINDARIVQKLLGGRAP